MEGGGVVKREKKMAIKGEYGREPPKWIIR